MFISVESKLYRIKFEKIEADVTEKFTVFKFYNYESFQKRTRKFIIIIINNILNIEYAKFNLYEDQPESIRIRVII